MFRHTVLGNIFLRLQLIIISEPSLKFLTTLLDFALQFSARINVKVLCPMLQGTYHAPNYASIIGRFLALSLHVPLTSTLRIHQFSVHYTAL